MTAAMGRRNKGSDGESARVCVCVCHECECWMKPKTLLCASGALAVAGRRDLPATNSGRWKEPLSTPPRTTAGSIFVTLSFCTHHNLFFSLPLSFSVPFSLHFILLFSFLLGSFLVLFCAPEAGAEEPVTTDPENNERDHNPTSTTSRSM